MRRLIFVNRFFYPDHSATSQILSDLAFHLAGAGNETHVVTGTQRYDAPDAALPNYELIDDVRVHRVSSTKYGRGALLGRSIDYISFYKSVWRCLMQNVRAGDLIVAKTDPPLLSVLAVAVAHRKRATLVNWLQDLYPEIAVQLGVPYIRGPVAGALVKLRNRSLRAAAANVAVGRLMGERLKAAGAAPERIHVIANWCDDQEIRPLADAENPLRQAWSLQDKFVVGYSGNLGRAHEFDTILAAAALLRGNPRFVFLMIGGGKKFDELKSATVGHSLEGSFRFMPYQERRLLAYSLAAADVHWVSLNPQLEGLLVPSKFYGIAAAGKPIIVIGDRNGELGRLVQQHGCGAVIAPGDASGLADTLLRLADDSAELKDLGRRARQMLDAHFTRQQALGRWRNLLDRICREIENPRTGCVPP
jgi:colanic acid biosynthesis glycosyl transferase WcaI